MPLNDHQPGDAVDCVLLVHEAERRRKADGGEFLRAKLGDRTGAVAAMVWDGVEEALAVLRPGEPVHVRGRFELHERYGPQIARARFATPAEGSFDPAALAPTASRDVDALERDLRELTATVRDPHLQRLLAELLGPDAALWPLFRDQPAAKHYHQAYPHGLLEHSLGVAQAVGTVSATFPGIDRDVAVTGALLHDIGKTQAYRASGSAIDFSDDGRLQGEIALGYFLVRSAMKSIEGFPDSLARAIGHIILSHHGSLEHGSPVVPATREATLVHMIDNLGGRLGSFDRLERQLAPGSAWSSYDAALGASAYFPARDDEEHETAPARAAA